MNFGQAIEALKEGQKVAREGWNGKGMWLASQAYMLADDWVIVTGLTAVDIDSDVPKPPLLRDVVASFGTNGPL